MTYYEIGPINEFGCSYQGQIFEKYQLYKEFDNAVSASKILLKKICLKQNDISIGNYILTFKRIFADDFEVV